MTIDLSLQFLIILDQYLRLILTSWPAVILILVLLIIFRHKKSIDDFIKRIRFIGPDGVKCSDKAEAKIVTEPNKDTVDKNNVAFISYKISSQLPNTVIFNFLNDWKVWFWIENYGPNKYKAYIKIKFIINNLEKDVTDGYYGGTQAWKLDAFNGIQAPGLSIPDEVRSEVKKGERIKIQINCTVNDENDILIEEKFPQTYVYDSQNNSWFLEP